MKFGQKIFHFNVLESTQDKAKDLAEKGERDGTVVLADRQTCGRGRLGRVWSSEKGGIWASLILRPKIIPQKAPLLALMASGAIADALEALYGIQCGLKWPNDVLIAKNKSYKKVGGILTEMRAESEKLHWVILGFGINVNNSIPLHLRESAISLKEAIHQELSQTLLLKEILKWIEGAYKIFLTQGFQRLKKRYLKKTILKRHTKVRLMDTEKRVEGEFEEIADDGALLLQTDKNKIEKFFAGDVRLI